MLEKAVFKTARQNPGDVVLVQNVDVTLTVRDETWHQKLLGEKKKVDRTCPFPLVCCLKGLIKYLSCMRLSCEY